MEAYCNCQSCGMPLKRSEDWGTEADQSRSTIYCIHCYRDGHFTDEAMSLRTMRKHVADQLNALHADKKTIDQALGRLPHLSRWLGIPAIHHHCQWH